MGIPRARLRKMREKVMEMMGRVIYIRHIPKFEEKNKNHTLGNKK